MKTSSLSYLTKKGYDDLRDHVITFAEYEGFPAHALSLQERVFQHEQKAQYPEELPASGQLGYHTLHASPAGVKCKRITRESTVSIEIGGILVLFTDAFFERKNSIGEMFGMDRLQDLILNQRNKSADELVNTIFETVYDFGKPARWDDDATLLIIKRTG